MIQVQVVSFVDCSCARIFVLPAVGMGGGVKGKVAGVGNTTEGQRFVSLSEKIPGKKEIVSNQRLTSSLLNM